MSSGSSTAVSQTPTPLADGPFATLTESQGQAFSRLKALVDADKEYWPDPSEGMSNAQDLNDHTLLYAPLISRKAASPYIT